MVSSQSTYFMTSTFVFALTNPRLAYHMCRHDVLVMVCGGSSITPFMSIIRELVYTSNMNQKTPKVLLVAAFKKSSDLSMLDCILPISGTSHDISQLQLQIQVYITRDTNPTTDSQELARCICFKQSDLEYPVTSVLGANSWLWLGAIISSSFIVFLVLVALVHQYYIHPIDHNTNMIYSDAARSSFSMILMCVSLVITATLAFLRNKKQNTRNTRQIQTTDAPTLTTSPVPVTESMHYKIERELESFSHQTFKEVTTVYYGERPNLKSK